MYFSNSVPATAGSPETKEDHMSSGGQYIYKSVYSRLLFEAEMISFIFLLKIKFVKYLKKKISWLINWFQHYDCELVKLTQTHQNTCNEEKEEGLWWEIKPGNKPVMSKHHPVIVDMFYDYFSRAFKVGTLANWTTCWPHLFLFNGKGFFPFALKNGLPDYSLQTQFLLSGFSLENTRCEMIEPGSWKPDPSVTYGEWLAASTNSHTTRAVD